MTVPAPYSQRSYGGGAVAAELVEAMGVSDLSFGITTTEGWTEASGEPLGTSGDFTTIIDRGTATVEKITCSAVNLATGIVTVSTGGRGADGTTAQAHVPNGSPSGVQTCWTSVEAAEANAAAVALLGQSPTNNEVLTWSSGAPKWVAPAAGIAGYAQITSNVTGITGPTVIVALQVTVAVAAGQTVKLTAFASEIGNATGLTQDQYSFDILEGVTQLGGGVCVAGGFCTGMAVVTPSAGSHTYGVSASHVTGSTAGVVVASSIAPAFLLVEVI